MNQPIENRKAVTIVKTVIFTFIITAILAIFVWYIMFYSRTITFVEPIQEIEVKEGLLDIGIVTTGELLPVHSWQVSLPESFFTDFSIDEVEMETLLEEGTKVDKGTVIAHLSRSVYETKQKAIETDLADLEKKIQEITIDSTKQLKDVKLALENAKLDLEIRKIAVEQSLFDPVSAHERMKLEFNKSVLAYENALYNYQDKRKALLEKYASYPGQVENLSSEAKTKLNQLVQALEIKSPYPGILKNIGNGPEIFKMTGKVLTHENRSVAEIEDISRLVSRFCLDEELYPSIQSGQEIRIFLRSNGVEIEGKISKVNKKIEVVDGKKCFYVEAQIDNAGLDLLPYQTTINKIKLQTPGNVLYVPNSSILAEDNKFYVFTSGGVKHEVKCRPANDEYTQIISGLSKGQLVYQNASEGCVK